MTVRLFPGSLRHKTTLIAGFLRQFRVEHELVRTEEYKSYNRTHHLGTDPAVEVDGQLDEREGAREDGVDPNVDALKKILKVN